MNTLSKYFFKYLRLTRSSNILASSLIFSIPLNDSTLNESVPNVSIKYLKCSPDDNACSTFSTLTIGLSSPDLGLPVGYNRLNILSTSNKFFPNTNLLSESDLTCSSGACWKNNHNFDCPTTKYLKTDGKTCDTSCASPNNPHYLPYLTATYNGNCTSKCDTKVTCLSTSALNTISNFTCKTGFNKTFFFCFADADKLIGAIHYGSAFNPPLINIPVSPAINSYHLEIWYFPDPRYLKKSTSTDWYFFQTNSFNCKKTSQSLTTVNDYACYVGSTKIGVDVEMKYLNWYRLAFSAIGSGTSYKFYFHFNKYNSSLADLSSSSNLQLSQIKFCTNDSANCANQLWASGFYKWLRVYDAQFMTVDVFKAKDVM